MIHGRVSNCDCVVRQWVATRHRLTASNKKDILYLCTRLYFELT